VCYLARACRRREISSSSECRLSSYSACRLSATRACQRRMQRYMHLVRYFATRVRLDNIFKSRSYLTQKFWLRLARPCLHKSARPRVVLTKLLNPWLSHYSRLNKAQVSISHSRYLRSSYNKYVYARGTKNVFFLFVAHKTAGLFFFSNHAFKQA